MGAGPAAQRGLARDCRLREGPPDTGHPSPRSLPLSPAGRWNGACSRHFISRGIYGGFYLPSLITSEGKGRARLAPPTPHQRSKEQQPDHP